MGCWLSRAARFPAAAESLTTHLPSFPTCDVWGSGSSEEGKPTGSCVPQLACSLSAGLPGYSDMRVELMNRNPDMEEVGPGGPRKERTNKVA